ncbi:hypothetical protein [uncultured Capnocytophaga sp.]|uniref:hypothetical protein n=1 Tax=uncultured Capnocytophaga sp. TaxID=159273 RepID=UPI0026137764|nr:hypothetical protein [uncultured Capnocytophaga sp.]
MIQKITKIIFIIFICFDLFLLTKAIVVYNNIESSEKKTAWVAYCLYYRDTGRRGGFVTKKLRVILTNNEKVTSLKQMPSIDSIDRDTIPPENDVVFSPSLFSVRNLPYIDFKDKVSYYIIDDFLFDKPQIVGFSTEASPKDKTQLFLDIYICYIGVYLTISPLIIFGLWALIAEKIFKTDKVWSYFFIIFVYKIFLLFIL